MPGTDPIAADALLSLLFPFWQLVIGCCVVVALVASVQRLAARGPSRMGRALLLTGAVIVGVAAFGLLLAV